MKQANIMVVEDDNPLRLLVSDVLEDLGHSVTEAASPQAALEVSSLRPYDLIVTDVRMEGMDGIELLLHLRDRQPQAHSLVMTGYADESVPRRAMAAGAADYIYKPFTASQFLQAVRRILDRETEARHHEDLLGRMLKGFSGWLQSRRQEASWPEVEQARTEAYRVLLVGIRSRALSEPDAWRAWNWLAETEELRRTRRDATSLDSTHQAYLKITRFLQAGDSSGSHSPRAMVELRAFKPLYASVGSGAVSLEQLKLADLLLRAGDLEGELQALKRAMWESGEA